MTTTIWGAMYVRLAFLLRGFKNREEGVRWIRSLDFQSLAWPLLSFLIIHAGPAVNGVPIHLGYVFVPGLAVSFLLGQSSPVGALLLVMGFVSTFLMRRIVSGIPSHDGQWALGLTLFSVLPYIAAHIAVANRAKRILGILQTQAISPVVDR